MSWLLRADIHPYGDIEKRTWIYWTPKGWAELVASHPEVFGTKEEAEQRLVELVIQQVSPNWTGKAEAVRASSVGPYFGGEARYGS